MAVQGGRARAQTEMEERETARRQRLAYQARVQEELHHQRRRMDEARLGLAHRSDQAQEQLRRERERLTTRAWWRRPKSLATSSWVRTGGARTTVTPTNSASAPTTTWPPLEASMLANVGDTDADVDGLAALEEGGGETRIVRRLDSTRDNLEEEVVEEMEVDMARDEEDETRERTVARGRGKGRGRGSRTRDY